MDIIDKLSDKNEWLAFLDYKKSGGHLTKADERDLTEYIEDEKYLDSAVYIQNGGAFSVPEAVLVNKSFSDKKRTVYKFSDSENYIQKMLAYQLLRFDGCFSSNLYSFRKNMGVKKAVKSLVYHNNINNMYSYKLDISDYFNSVNPELLLPELSDVLKGEERLYKLIEDMLLNPYAVIDGEKVEIKKGILAGSPLSGFLADLYIRSLDEYFEKRGILYARYSDDIIVFSETEKELVECAEYIRNYLSDKGLEINESKVFQTFPKEEWSFLGFSYSDGTIDVSDVSTRKLKKKMRRKARALLRWKNNKNAAHERAVKAYISYFNKKLYSNPVVNEITWTRWYFPLINTDKSLKEIDSYMQQCIRYIATGSQSKKKYSFTYEQMKKLGYIPLVSRYYAFKKDGILYL